MMECLAGALLERPPGPKYTSALRFAEIAPAPPLPKPNTLARWRAALPEGFRIALRAPVESWKSPSGALRGGAELDAGLQWLGEAADALRAELLVVATGPEVTTGQRDRDRLVDYFGRVPRAEGRILVWRATGLWEPGPLQRLSESMAVLGGFDPVDDPPPRTPFLYGCLEAEGLRRSFSHAQLVDVADKIRAASAERAFVTISSPQSFREAQLLQSLFDEGQ
jgi:uncharacterized protein YecE (DUF72 family)